ncbi:MAG: hypothetical protein U9P61_01945 [Patescibacteria group bacterium]|nr:hypothetical protein [Patescibacteria group bacterium]
MKKIKDKDKKIVIASVLLIFFLIFTTYFHFKDLPWKSFHLPLIQEMENAPSFFDNISEEDREAITETYSLLKSSLEKNYYEEHNDSNVSFEIPLGWKEEDKEDEKDNDIILCSFFSEEDYFIDIFQLETNNSNTFLEELKKEKENFSFSKATKEETNYFVEAEGVENNKKKVSFFKLISDKNFFYAISVTIPEEDVFKEINLINHTLSSLKILE